MGIFLGVDNPNYGKIGATAKGVYIYSATIHELMGYYTS
jgi:hypothetical protein